MKLTKADYMRLPKERLAELLVERDNEQQIEFIPANPIPDKDFLKRSGWGCDGSTCTNPQMDCINCPLTMHYHSVVTTNLGGKAMEDEK